jgi:hypothetical protein
MQHAHEVTISRNKRIILNEWPDHESQMNDDGKNKKIFYNTTWLYDSQNIKTFQDDLQPQCCPWAKPTSYRTEVSCTDQLKNKVRIIAVGIECDRIKPSLTHKKAMISQKARRHAHILSVPTDWYNMSVWELFTHAQRKCTHKKRMLVINILKGH